MKTYHIKDLLKKDLLIIELPERTSDFSVLDTGEAIAVCAFDEYDACLDVKGIAKGYTLLGKPDEISEDDAMELVKKVMYSQHFQNYKARKENDFASLWCKTATESLLSAIESVIFWENPIPPFAKQGEDISVTYTKWEKAQEKTFDRSRSIILVKN